MGLQSLRLQSLGLQSLGLRFATVGGGTLTTLRGRRGLGRTIAAAARALEDRLIGGVIMGRSACLGAKLTCRRPRLIVARASRTAGSRRAVARAVATGTLIAWRSCRRLDWRVARVGSARVRSCRVRSGLLPRLRRVRRSLIGLRPMRRGWLRAFGCRWRLVLGWSQIEHAFCERPFLHALTPDQIARLQVAEFDDLLELGIRHRTMLLAVPGEIPLDRLIIIRHARPFAWPKLRGRLHHVCAAFSTERAAQQVSSALKTYPQISSMARQSQGSLDKI